METLYLPETLEPANRITHYHNPDFSSVKALSLSIINFVNPTNGGKEMQLSVFDTSNQVCASDFLL